MFAPAGNGRMWALVGQAWVSDEGFYVDIGIEIEGELAHGQSLQALIHEEQMFELADEDRQAILLWTMLKQAFISVPFARPSRTDRQMPDSTRMTVLENGTLYIVTAAYRTSRPLKPGQYVLTFGEVAEEAIGIPAGTEVVVEAQPLP